MTEDQNEFEAVVKSYLSWADLHFDGSGLKPPFLQTWKDTIPFFEASSSSQVVADIKTLLHGKPVSRAPEPLLAARLFLYFAQEFDRQNQEVVRDLKRHRQQEAELIRRLKMEDDSLTAQFQKEDVQEPDDSADYLVLDRLGAWTRIFLKDTDHIRHIYYPHPGRFTGITRSYANCPKIALYQIHSNLHGIDRQTRPLAGTTGVGSCSCR